MGLTSLQIENRSTKNTKKYLIVHTVYSILLLSQEIFVEILGGNLSWL
jgi:hypothetical protein